MVRMRERGQRLEEVREEVRALVGLLVEGVGAHCMSEAHLG
jgi:hypothetical protein